MEGKHLVDWVWMQPAGGGEPKKVSTKGDAISKAMWQGYSQVDSPAHARELDEKRAQEAAEVLPEQPIEAPVVEAEPAPAPKKRTRKRTK